jgi:hypothetical protein
MDNDTSKLSGPVFHSPVFHTSTALPLLVRKILAFAFISLASSLAFPQTTTTTATTPVPDPKAVPVIDGGIGPCSADFTVTDSAGAPVYAAKVKVHIAYGFMSAHRLDLELGTNADGKAHFIGLPDRIKHGLYFHATEGDREGEAFDDPANTCKAQFTITLQKKPQ